MTGKKYNTSSIDESEVLTMNSTRILLKGGSYYEPTGRFIPADILICGGKIAQIGTFSENEAGQTLDISGHLVIPGFIDIHIQGAGGSDCLEGNKEALNTISRTIAREGTTGFLATTVMMPEEENPHLPAIASLVNQELEGANLLGIHLEGPFINPIKKGGIIPSAIGKPSRELFEKVLSLCHNTLKIMTIAPELEGNLDLIKALKEKAIIAAFGHSDADYEQTLAGIEAGIEHVTHLFNAMRPIHHRQPGPLAALLDNPRITAQIISDGKHIHPVVVKMVYRLLKKERCILITDGMSGLGLGDGYYEYHGRKYISQDGTSQYLDGTLNGTTIGLGALSRRFCHFTGCRLEIVLPMGTLNPARLLGIDDRKGSIEEGKDADLVIVDYSYEVITTICNGRVVYSRE